jgi:hypothetical protein
MDKTKTDHNSVFGLMSALRTKPVVLTNPFSQMEATRVISHDAVEGQAASFSAPQG